MGGVFGREAGLGAVDAVLTLARLGLAALVLEGDPGIGKTTVWREGIARAAGEGFRVLSCRAAPTDARLSFTALGDLLAPVEPAAFDALPDPQRRALDAALLRAEPEGAAPNPRAIGTGIVSLLCKLSASAPVLLAIDDLQWLDLPSARTLEFALRRLEPHPIAVLATVRPGERASGLLSTRLDERIRSLRLGPLSLGALYRIIEDELGHGLPRPLLVRIERAAAGNPLYALEIARALEAEGSPAQGHELPIPDDLRELVTKRLRRLPGRTREALLRVSALAQPTTALVDAADLAPAEEAGVVRVHSNGRIEIAHPLFAAAIYAAATHEPRRRLHAELAQTATDVEDRARHLMLTRAGNDTDEHVAGVLHDGAEHALRRGAIDVAAELEEQSARRTPTPQTDVHWQRSLRAARHHLKAGDPGQSRALCEEVLGARPPSSVRAHALGQLAETWATERPKAAMLLLQEALACVGDEAGHAAQLEIALAFVLGVRLGFAHSNDHLIRAVELAERAGDSALIAEAIALKACLGLFSGQGLDERALERALALEDLDREVAFQMRTSLNVAQAYAFTGRLDLARELFVNLRERLLAHGEEADLAWVLGHLAQTAWLAGDLEVAEREASDAERVAALTGVEIFRAFALMIRAMVRATRGDRGGARADATEAITVSERVGWPIGVGQARWALGFLALSEADPEAAVAMLEPVVGAVEAGGVYEWPVAMSLPDAIEAFVAIGELERASRLTEALADWGRKFDRAWPLATSGRCRALLDAARGDLDSAIAATEQALVAHQRLPMPFELGRTLLVQGQLKRRSGERRAAREALTEALAIFGRVGARLWAERATEELRRIPIRRGAAHDLTPTEEKVAALAGAGQTNREVSQALFMSSKTVEANLTRVYGKLGIRSRAELGLRMLARRDTSTPAKK